MSSTIENIKKQYYENYADICIAADSIVEDLKSFFTTFQRAYLLQIKQYPLYRFESRIKSWESIADKIERKEQYRDVASLYDIPDIIGVYVIVELDEDVDKVIKLFEREKSYLLQHSHVTSLEYSPTRHENGKLSHHYDGVYTLKGRNRLEKYNFEIQLRSEVENLWSNIEHMSFYKNRTKNRNDRILNRLKEHSYNLLLQADDVLSILRRERMKNDLLDLKEKMTEALENVFDGIKIRDIEAISDYLYKCLALPFDSISVEELEQMFIAAARMEREQIDLSLQSFQPVAEHQRLYDYLVANMSLSDEIILKIGLSVAEPRAAIEYLLSSMEEARCKNCGQWLNYADADFFAAMVEMRGDFYCRTCAETLLKYCTVCGSILTTEKICRKCTRKGAKDRRRHRSTGSTGK